MTIKQGDLIKSRGGNWHQVLKVKGSGHVQSTNGMSIQSRNEEKATARIYIFDGEYMNIRSIEEVEKLYVDIASLE